MSWFRIDDQSAFHPKVLAAGNEGWGALTRAGATSAGQRTDGFVAESVALLIAPLAVWEHLVEVKLLVREDGGWRIHDYLDWNPSARQLDKISRARAAAGKSGGRRSSKARATTHDDVEASAQAIASSDVEAKGWDQDGMGSGSSPEGVQGGRPGAKAKRATRCPPSDFPQADLVAWLETWGLKPGGEVDHWLDHHRAKGSTFIDWAAAWRTWQRNGSRFGRPPPGPNGHDKRTPRGRIVQGDGGYDDPLFHPERT